MQFLYREQEDVDGHVGELLDVLLQLAAVRAIRIGKHRDLAAAVTLDLLDRQIERQLLERKCKLLELLVLDLPLPGIGDVGHGLGLDDAAVDQESEVFIGIDHLPVDNDFVKSRDKTSW